MTVEEIIKAIAGPTKQSEIAAHVVELITDDVALTLASAQYQEEPNTYKGEDGLKKLSNDTFGAMKHYLRGKIHGLVDFAWQLSAVRKPLREKANAAAKTELDSVA